MHPKAPPPEWTEPREVPKWNTISAEGRGETRKKGPTKPAEGTKKIQRWKDASGTDTSARANQECTAQQPPRCAPDANGQNAAVSEMAGATGRAVKSRAKLDDCEDGSVTSSTKGARCKLGRHERNKGRGRGRARARDRRTAQERKERRKLVQELTKLAEEDWQPRARHNKRKDDDGPCP